jgi:hypothetical protein
MAHFAQLDDQNKVINVVVVANENVCDGDGIEKEELGVRFLKQLFGETTEWVQTSYNGNFRFRYAGIGFTYDSMHDVFLYPKPEKPGNWMLATETWEWTLTEPVEQES